MRPAEARKTSKTPWQKDLPVVSHSFLQLLAESQSLPASCRQRVCLTACLAVLLRPAVAAIGLGRPASALLLAKDPP